MLGEFNISQDDFKIVYVSRLDEGNCDGAFKLIEKGEDCTLESVLADINQRDNNDSTRKVAPAVPAEDAVFLDNSDLTIEGTVAKAIEIVSSKVDLGELK